MCQGKFLSGLLRVKCAAVMSGVEARGRSHVSPHSSSAPRMVLPGQLPSHGLDGEQGSENTTHGNSWGVGAPAGKGELSGASVAFTTVLMGIPVWKLATCSFHLTVQ